jgi:hypothetical protein
VLHREPERLLTDDVRETVQVTSVLSLIGRGCHRVSEIAARLQKPATSLSRPLTRLLELELARRDVPFGSSLRETKKTLYRIADPFLRFWFRFIDVNLTRLEARQLDGVAADVSASFESHVATVWEDLVRSSIPRARWFGLEWQAASPWWGGGVDRKPLELDVVAESVDRSALLLGEVKWSSGREATAAAARLMSKSTRFPLTAGRRVFHAIWLRGPSRQRLQGVKLFTPAEVLGAAR